MSNRWLPPVTFTLIALACAAPHAASAAPPLDALEPIAEALMDTGAPGGIVLRRDGDSLQHVVFGLADLEANAPMRPQLRFRAGSIAKPFIASVVMRLVGEGVLSLDDPITSHLRGLMPPGDTTTIRHLLNHTSGIAEYWNDERFQTALFSKPLRVWDPRELARIGLDRPRIHGTGTAWGYSNTNYVLLGRLPRGTHERSRGWP